MPASRDILLQAPDIEAAASFYESQLGLTVFMREPNMIGLEAGAFRLYLDRSPALGPVFEFFVPDLQAAKNSLTAAGATIEAEDPAIPRCYIRDPFGLIYNIAEKRD
jgi:catechol 2,3-dioxygenase-like lactoylglutathione lyase family enzyme